MSRTFPLAVAGLAFLAASPTGLPAQAAFEGVIVSTVYAGGSPMEMTTSLKGGLARMDLPLTQGSGAYQLMDLAKGTMTAVMPGQKMFMTMDFKAMGETLKDRTPNGPAPKITATGKRETIAGHPCEHYLIESDGSTMDVCAAKGMGFMGMIGGGNPMSGGRGAASIPLEYRDLYEKFKDGFQPLKVERVEGERRTLFMQVKSIERKALDASLFAVPKGYRDMSSMMRGGMPSMPRPPRG